MALTALTAALSTSTLASAWTVKADFEGGPIGGNAQSPNPDAFHGTAGDSKYVSSPVNTGAQAGSVSVQGGTEGFGSWGGGFNFPAELHTGDEVWFRVYVYYPSGWSFDCGGCTQGMKFMRIHTASAGGANEGYEDVLIKGGTTGGLIEASCYEIDGTNCHTNNNNGALLHGLGTPVPRDKWQAFEQYVKFSSVAGQGIYRLWQDGVLIFEDTKTVTLRSPTSKSDFIYLYTYWNNGAPKTQTSYVDSIVITSDTPAQKDAKGNPYIGLVTGSGTGGTGGSGTGGSAGQAGAGGGAGASVGGSGGQGASAGAGGTAGNGANAGNGGSGSGAAGGGATSGASGQGGASAATDSADDESGCGCRVPSSPGKGGTSLAALAFALLTLVRRGRKYR